MSARRARSRRFDAYRTVELGTLTPPASRGTPLRMGHERPSPGHFESGVLLEFRVGATLRSLPPW